MPSGPASRRARISTFRSCRRILGRGVQLLAANELDPYLPANVLTVMRDQLARSVAARNQSPGFLTRHSLRQALFPATDPSLRFATPASIHALTPDEVQAYYHNTFRPDLTTIVVIGKVSPAQVLSVIEKYFGAWKAAGSKPPTDLPQVPPNQAGRRGGTRLQPGAGHRGARPDAAAHTQQS